MRLSHFSYFQYSADAVADARVGCCGVVAVEHQFAGDPANPRIGKVRDELQQRRCGEPLAGISENQDFAARRIHTSVQRQGLAARGHLDDTHQLRFRALGVNELADSLESSVG